MDDRHRPLLVTLKDATNMLRRFRLKRNPREEEATNSQTRTTALCQDPSVDGKRRRKKKKVHFGSVAVREYPMTLGDNPSVSFGCPVTIDWIYFAFAEVPVDLFEEKCKRANLSKHYRHPRFFLLSAVQREDILSRAGHSRGEIKSTSRRVLKAQRERNLTRALGPLGRF